MTGLIKLNVGGEIRQQLHDAKGLYRWELEMLTIGISISKTMTGGRQVCQWVRDVRKRGVVGSASDPRGGKLAQSQSAYHQPPGLEFRRSVNNQRSCEGMVANMYGVLTFKWVKEGHPRQLAGGREAGTMTTS